ncbi:MAG: RluA family pseudouridine synthase [Oligoflexia bacterium]|nr:RluA family pseudouridine synthase [Oligoflexia bacterium]
MAKQEYASPDTYLVSWTVEPGEGGLRLDLFLKDKYRKLSRESLQKSIKSGGVKLNDRQVKPGQILKVQDKVQVLSLKKKEPIVDFNFEVLFEDEDIIVVNKPGNLPVHPTGRFFFHTLLTQLKITRRGIDDLVKDFYVVHRIDRETSGVLVMGKHSEAAAHLVRQFEIRQPQKEYLALVKGIITQDRFEIDAPMGKDIHAEIKLKMNVVEMGKNGEPLYLPKSEVLEARTAFEVVSRIGNFTLLRCMPKTGRQHQIRVHLFHFGFPIVGDKLYGTSADFFLKATHEGLSVEVGPGLSMPRHALHAHQLEFVHPRTKEALKIQAPLPKDFQDFMDKVQRIENEKS